MHIDVQFFASLSFLSKKVVFTQFSQDYVQCKLLHFFVLQQRAGATL